MIFQGDTIIKTAIELGIEDMRKNPYLIDDMLSDFTANPYLKIKYGQKQVDSCKEWFANNQIDVYLRGRSDDKDRYPCVTISLGNSSEKPEMKSMADQSTESVQLMPKTVNKPIPYVVKPFTPAGYDPMSGAISFDPDTVDLRAVAAGMILVNPENGEGFVIQEVFADSFMIEPGLEFEASQLGIVPQFQFYKARREHSFFQETYNIGCHAHGDPQTLLWLHSIVIYSILRYRESLLEATGFAESSIASGDLSENPNFTGAGGEKAWSRYITLNGQIENSWLKSPRRYIEKVNVGEVVNGQFVGGIKILSNLDAPSFEDLTKDLWYTVEDSDDSETP